MTQRRGMIAGIVLVVVAALFGGRASAAVVLGSFSAQGQAEQIHLTWITTSEINHAGFSVLRSASPSGSFMRINAALIPGCGGCVAGASYAYDDQMVLPGKTYYYILESRDWDGGTQQSGIVFATSSSPAATPTITRTSTPTATSIPTPTSTPRLIYFPLVAQQEGP